MGPLNSLGAAILGLGVILTLWVLNSARLRSSLLLRAVRVDGRVIRIRSVTSSSNDESSGRTSSRYYPTVQFEANNGQTIERELPGAGEPSKWKVGRVIPLIYEQGNPGNVVDREMRWGDIVMNSVGTLIILGIGYLLCFCVESTPAKSMDEASRNSDAQEAATP